MKIELHFHIMGQPVRVKELSGDSARFIPSGSDRVILGGEVFFVTTRTFDLDKDIWTIVLTPESVDVHMMLKRRGGSSAGPSEPVY